MEKERKDIEGNVEKIIIEFPLVKSRKKKRTKKKRLVLSRRDFEILDFIHDMKFASINELYPKFFAKLPNGERSVSDEWAKKRLRELVQAGFLTRARSFFDPTVYYLGTRKSLIVLRNAMLEKDALRPLKEIYHSTFNHDRAVLQERMKLEAEHGEINWISDRRLRCGEFKRYGLQFEDILDAVYTLPSGERIALEVEISRKKPILYGMKVSEYVYLIRSQGATYLSKAEAQAPIQKVRYLVASPIVRTHIKRETEIYGEMFSVEWLGSESQGRE